MYLPCTYWRAEKSFKEQRKREVLTDPDIATGRSLLCNTDGKPPWDAAGHPILEPGFEEREKQLIFLSQIRLEFMCNNCFPLSYSARQGLHTSQGKCDLRV